MIRPPSQSALIQALSNFFKESNLSPWQIALLSLGLMGLLYVTLLMGLSRPGTTTQVIPQNAQPTPLSAPASDSGDELGSTFLGEYERLSGAQSATNTPSLEASTAATTASWAGALTFSLVMVLGLAYASIWGFKQVSRRSGGAGLSVASKQLDIQETEILGPNQKLHLVRLGQEILLLGATDHTITCLGRYDAEHIAESFDEHLQVALHPQANVSQPVPLQESLDALRKMQHRGRGADDA